MVTDARVRRIAEILVDYSTRVEEGETVLVWGTSEATRPLVVQACREVIGRGALPIAVVEYDEITQALLQEASDDLLRHCRDPWVPLADRSDVTLRIETGVGSHTLGADPRKVALRGAAEHTLAQALHRTRLLVTLFPTAEAARETGMDLAEFEDYVFGAVDQDWTRFGSEQQKFIDSVLSGAQTVSIKAEDTDLTVSVGGRTFLSCDGTKNMPGGEILTSPVDDSAEGYIAFTYPAIFPPFGGRRVEGVRLWFEKGRAVKATAREGQEYLEAMLDLDRGARYVGELAFGTNPGLGRWTGSILLDEKMAGTMHLALGQAYAEAGGVNRSSIHWDFITDLKPGSEVRVDGTLVQRDGRWVR